MTRLSFYRITIKSSPFMQSITPSICKETFMYVCTYVYVLYVGGVRTSVHPPIPTVDFAMQQLG